MFLPKTILALLVCISRMKSLVNWFCSIHRVTKYGEKGSFGRPISGLNMRKFSENT
jgi:hypothetical protein